MASGDVPVVDSDGVTSGESTPVVDGGVVVVGGGGAELSAGVVTTVVVVISTQATIPTVT